MKKTAILICLALLAGCAQYGGMNQPVVDTFNDKFAYRLNQDIAECQILAKQSSGGAVTKGAIGGAVGGIGGAASGATIGAIAGGNAGLGAAIGGAAGLLGGIGYKSHEADQRYRYAYNNCLSNRGHNIVR